MTVQKCINCGIHWTDFIHLRDKECKGHVFKMINIK